MKKNSDREPEGTRYGFSLGRFLGSVVFTMVGVGALLVVLESCQ